MGEMASTLAHELNQPLAAIANYSMGCVNRLQSGEYRQEDILYRDAGEASAQAERAGKIIRRVREFVRKSEAAPRAGVAGGYRGRRDRFPSKWTARRHGATGAEPVARTTCRQYLSMR